jgi:hypothetical protein
VGRRWPINLFLVEKRPLPVVLMLVSISVFGLRRNAVFVLANLFWRIIA